MRRKLLLLNISLAVLVVYAGWQLRSAWLAAKAREAAALNRKVPKLAPPPFTPLPQTPPVLPTGYADIAQKMLFDKSRNPTVVVDLPKVAPPPPKPMPALPVYYGSMNLGDGPTAILSAVAGSAQQAVRPGERIGQFKLVDVNTEEIVFEWDGQIVHKKLNEVGDRGSQQAQPVETAARTEAPAAAAPTNKTPMGPGGDAGRGYRSCEINDSNPPGTVADGFRKVMLPTPFGQVCRWEPVAH